MARFEKERKFIDLVYSRLGIVVLFVIAIILSLSVISVFGKRSQARKQTKAAEARLASLEVRKTELTADIERLNTDKGKEEAIRERYRQALPGEELIVIVSEEEEPKSEAAIRSEEDFFVRIGIFFRDLFNN